MVTQNCKWQWGLWVERLSLQRARGELSPKGCTIVVEANEKNN